VRRISPRSLRRRRKVSCSTPPDRAENFLSKRPQNSSRFASLLRIASIIRFLFLLSSEGYRKFPFAGLPRSGDSINPSLAFSRTSSQTFIASDVLLLGSFPRSGTDSAISTFTCQFCVSSRCEHSARTESLVKACSRLVLSKSLAFGFLWKKVSRMSRRTRRSTNGSSFASPFGPPISCSSMLQSALFMGSLRSVTALYSMCPAFSNC
jgi:hypothetical protein